MMQSLGIHLYNDTVIGSFSGNCNFRGTLILLIFAMSHRYVVNG